MLKENCRRRIVREVRRGRGTERTSTSKPSLWPLVERKKVASLKTNLPFHLSPRPLFTPHIMDSLLCDIINHSRVQRGVAKSTSPVLILNEPWDEHERKKKKASKRRRERESRQNANRGNRVKSDEVRPASICSNPSFEKRCAKRRRVVSPQELASLHNKVGQLRVSGKIVEVSSCAPPPSFCLNEMTSTSISSNPGHVKLPATSSPSSVTDVEKDAHILAFKRWSSMPKSPRPSSTYTQNGLSTTTTPDSADDWGFFDEVNSPTIEDLELSSAEESHLNQAFGKLAMGTGIRSRPTMHNFACKPLITEIALPASTSSTTPP